MDLRIRLPAGWLLLIILCLPAFSARAAEPVIIAGDSINLTSFPMAYYVDQSESLSFSDVRQQVFQPSTNGLSLGTASKTTWSRLLLENHSGHDQTLFLHHPYAYHNRLVGFYLENNATLIDKQIVDMDDAATSPLMYRGSAVYRFDLPAGSKRTLYVKSVSYSHQWFTLLLLDEDHSRRALIGTHTDIALLTGVLLALIFYNFLLYFASSNRENVYYSLYLISGAIWISLSYGLLSNLFNVYGSGIFNLHISLITMPIFLILFMTSIFATKDNYPTEHRFLNGMLLLLAADLFYALFDIQTALKPASTLAALMMVVTISVSISLYRKGNPLAGFFLIGHSCFLIFNALAVLFYKGLIGFSYIASHGVGIGITLEALMLAFIIAYRIRILERIKASQAELKLQAATDPLTRLYNRRFFNAEADYLLNLASRQGTSMAALAIDIDHFKSINDTHGHQTGDKVLVELARTLKANSRSSDIIARFGGEEFMILLPNCHSSEAMKVAEKLRAAAEACRIEAADGTPLTFTISIGLAVHHQTAGGLKSLLDQADKALYQAKYSGRNNVQAYGG